MASEETKVLTLDGLQYFATKMKNHVKDGYVAKRGGYDLSSNDYTDDEKTKLAGITDDANAVSFSRSLSNGIKIGTITIDGVGTDLYCEKNTDTTYSAGSNISISSDRKISGNYPLATASASGLMSANDKAKLDSTDGYAEKIGSVKVNGTALSIADDKSVNIDLSAYAKSSTLSKVATSGKYSDLLEKPTIPTILPNPYALTIKNSAGTPIATYDGSSKQELTLNKSVVGLGNVDNLKKEDLLKNADLGGTPTATTPGSTDNSTRIATTAFVQGLINDKIESSKAMRFKGTLGSGGTITALPTTHTVGDTYRVITAGKYAGQNCEVGDMITCIVGGTTAADSHWTVIQSNVDGAVVGPASSVNERVAIFNGGTGKSIKDSGVLISELVKFGDLTKEISNAITGLSVNGTTITYTRKNGTSGTITTQDTNTTYSNATQSVAGLMSTTDKQKLDGIATGATKITVDSALSSTSENPVQNKAINSALAGKLPNFVNNIGSTNAGNPRQVKFISVNYNTAATYFKMSATSCHDNGTSYQFLEDIIIGVTVAGDVVCNVYKYCQQTCGTDSYNLVDDLERYYGDVFYTINETTKVVDFYILMGQYASAQFTPPTKIGSTTIAYVTPYSGSPIYHSSGARNWANGNSTLYATLKDIPDVSGFETKANAITGLSVSGTKITYTKGNGTTGSITTQDTKVTVDTALSSTSTNPVQNKVINTALAGKADSSHTHSYLPLSGGTVSDKIIISGSNPHLGLRDTSGSEAYLQTHDDGSGLKVGFGYGWSSSMKLDGNGNIYSAASIYQDGKQVANKEDIPNISGKQDKLTAGSNITISGTTISATYGVATTSANGLMSSTDKSKLDGIQAGADAVSFTRSLSSGTKIGTITINDVATELFCQTNTDTTYGNASSTSAGLMSANDKSKLDGITASADSVSISRILTSGTKIGAITINGETTDLYCQTNTTYSAGTGLALNGTTINHSNSVTAQTSYIGSATAVPRIKYDAQGHITGVTTDTIYPPTTAGTAGQIWISNGSGSGAWRSLVTISTAEPSGGQDGDLWFQYE